MPKQIKYAIITIVISVLLGCLDFMFQFLNITKQQAEINSTDIFVGILLTGILLFFIAKRHNGARWVFIIITVLGFLFVIPIFLKEIDSDKIGALSTTIQVILHVFAIVLMLQKPVDQWFKNKNQEG
jgi:peptidoglycan/LPS O-acetylase OafA/YrhL